MTKADIRALLERRIREFRERLLKEDEIEAVGFALVVATLDVEDIVLTSIVHTRMEPTSAFLDEAAEMIRTANLQDDPKAIEN